MADEVDELGVHHAFESAAADRQRQQLLDKGHRPRHIISGQGNARAPGQCFVRGAGIDRTRDRFGPLIGLCSRAVVPERQFGIADAVDGLCLDVRGLNGQRNLQRFARVRKRSRGVVLPQKQLRQVAQRTAFQRSGTDGTTQFKCAFQMLPCALVLAEPEPVRAHVAERNRFAVQVLQLPPDRQIQLIEFQSRDLVVTQIGEHGQHVEEHALGPAQSPRPGLGQTLVRQGLARSERRPAT